MSKGVDKKLSAMAKELNRSYEKIEKFEQIFRGFGFRIPPMGYALWHRLPEYEILISLIEGKNMTFSEATDVIEMAGYGRKSPNKIREKLDIYIRKGMVTINEGKMVFSGERKRKDDK